MSVKVLGGISKGFTLKVPNKVRPTSILLRRKVFDANQNWHGKVFIDLCSGSGVMGIEAWSRGARKVILIEESEAVFSVIIDNVKKISISYFDNFKKFPIECFNISAIVWINTNLSSLNYDNLVIFFDPPYKNHVLYDSLISLLIKIKFSGVLWFESDSKKGIPIDYISNWNLKHNKVFYRGDSYISIINFASHT